MDTQISAKIQALEAQMEAKEQAMAKKYRVTTMVTLILSVVVAIYTTVLGNLLLDLTSPKAMATYFKGFLNEQLPGIRRMMIAEAKAAAPQYVKMAGNQVLGFIPNAEMEVQHQIDLLTDQVLLDIKSQTTPALGAFLSSISPEVKEKLKTKAEGDIEKAFALCLVETADNELDKVFDKNLVKHIGTVNDQIVKITRNERPANRREAAIRKALIHWAWLSQHQDATQHPFESVLETLKDRFGAILPSATVPMPVTEPAEKEEK